MRSRSHNTDSTGSSWIFFPLIFSNLIKELATLPQFESLAAFSERQVTNLFSTCVDLTKQFQRHKIVAQPTATGAPLSILSAKTGAGTSGGELKVETPSEVETGEDQEAGDEREKKDSEGEQEEVEEEEEEALSPEALMVILESYRARSPTGNH